MSNPITAQHLEIILEVNRRLLGEVRGRFPPTRGVSRA